MSQKKCENINYVDVMGFKVFDDILDKIPIEGAPRMINTISPHSYSLSVKDKTFRQALKNTEYLVLDGVFFAISSILLRGKNIIKNQGPDVFYHFIKRINDISGRVFFLGASNDTLIKIKERLATEYPNIVVDFLSPPYKQYFTEEDNISFRERINEFNPDVLFVGMTCPKQEKWAYQNYKYLNVKLICSIGAVFDWYAGKNKEISGIWWKLRLGWLIRLLQRPEIIKRYPITSIYFLHLFLALIGVKKYRNGNF
jgi:N-acetylglucosaminyldiphosphoundecaprenol N-acetyl-beta-D-mannosaminyltransferase